MNLSFAGCGFLGLYHIGVASCFKEYAPNILVRKVSGTSAGALAAAAMICDCPLSQIISDAFNLAKKARMHALGPFHPYFDVSKILRDRLILVLPDDAHVRCTGKLFVSVTRVSDGENYIISEFDSKEELIQVLLCSSFIPVFSGIVPPSYRGIRYMDGCYSDNLPLLDENTVTVSPFGGESDICPSDKCHTFAQMNVANTSIDVNSKNIFRFLRILFPSSPDLLSKMCQQGFDDALHFLKRNNLVSCSKCPTAESTLHIVPSQQEYDPWEEIKDKDTSSSCQDCERKIKSADTDSPVPDDIIAALEDACGINKKGIMHWLSNNRASSILQFVALPYLVPIDLTVSSFFKMMELVPKMQGEVSHLLQLLLKYVVTLLKRIYSQKHLYSAQFACQLAITGFSITTTTDDQLDGGSKLAHRNTRRLSLRCNADHQMQRRISSSGRSPSSAMLSRLNFDICMDMSMKSESEVPQRCTSATSIDMDQIIDVTSQQEPLMSCVYMDGETRMKVTEIYETPANFNLEDRGFQSQMSLDSSRRPSLSAASSMSSVFFDDDPSSLRDDVDFSNWQSKVDLKIDVFSEDDASLQHVRVD